MSEEPLSPIDRSVSYTDEKGADLYTWCWPYPPKNFSGPSEYTYETLSKIPNGSLYFSSRKGPLSEMSARITGSPYDMIGIVLQSRTPGREGTYVYTVDSTFLPSDRMAEKVVVINLADLISDDTIIHHAVLPLKDFDEPANDGARHRHVVRRSYEEDHWRTPLKKRRNDILRELFRKYREMSPEHDAYQTLASMAGLPVAESLRSKNALTAAELVGLILFQAGLIWDDRFGADDQNPACCFDDCFFQSSESETGGDSEVVVNLMTPKTFTEAKYRRRTPPADLSVEEKGGEDLQSYLHRAFNESSDEEDWTEPNEKGSPESDEEERPRRRRHSEPVEKPIYARTILFGSLRPVDFLRDYYRSVGFNPQDQSDLRSIRPLTGRRGASGELVAIIHSLANQRDGSDEVNQLNMSWYHDNLIPIELDNNCDEGCENRIEDECRMMKGLVQRIDQDFVQKHMLHMGTAALNGARLLWICRQASEIAAELHALACECDSYVRSGDDPDGTLASDYNAEKDHQKFKIRVDSQGRIGPDYILVLHKYMWGGGWKYDWTGPLKCHPDKHYEISCRMKRLLEGLGDLKNRTPVSCIILELIVCLLEQADAMNQYITQSRRYCLKGRGPASRSLKHSSD